MDKANFIMLMETFMKESGSTIKLMGRVHILTQTARSMLVNGKRINNME